MVLNKHAAMARYDAVFRTNVMTTDPESEVIRDGNLTFVIGPDAAAQANWASFLGTAADAVSAIPRAITFFKSRGHGFEWKWFSHDGGETLARALTAAGFAPSPLETIVMLEVKAPRRLPQALAGIVVKPLTRVEQFTEIVKLLAAVWGEEEPWLGEALRRAWEAAPEHTKFHLAYAGSQLVSCAWIRFEADIGSLWGGATLEGYRGRGIYRHLVDLRYNEALDRGMSYLLVEASDMSRPILERLGFSAVATTQPYLYHLNS